MTTAIVHEPKTRRNQRLPLTDHLDGTEAPPVEDTADVTSSDIPNAGASLDVCKSALARIDTQFAVLETSMGRIGWLKGRVLQRAKSACEAEGKRWDEFCEEIRLPRSTAALFLRIAEKYPRESQVTGKTLTQLRDAVKTRNNAPATSKKKCATIRIEGPTLDRLPQDLEQVLKLLTAALGMDYATSLDEATNPATAYADCIAQLRHIEERARECVAAFQGRIDNLIRSGEIASEARANLESREAA